MSESRGRLIIGVPGECFRFPI